MDYVRVRPTPSVSTRDARVFMITADLADPAYQAYLLLRNAFTITLILAGADKFWNAMIDWVQYLAPVIPQTLGIAPEIFLRGVGVVEIALGILIAFVPRRAAYWAAGWLGADRRELSDGGDALRRRATRPRARPRRGGARSSRERRPPLARASTR